MNGCKTSSFLIILFKGKTIVLRQVSDSYFFAISLYSIPFWAWSYLLMDSILATIVLSVSFSSLLLVATSSNLRREPKAYDKYEYWVYESFNLAFRVWASYIKKAADPVIFFISKFLELYLLISNSYYLVKNNK